MRILGIESSCDETSCSIVEDGKYILSNVVYSQIKDHASFGGIVPELASRKHLELINAVIDKAFREAKLSYRDIDLVGVVHKPGLIGSLLIGLETAKAFAYQFDLPLVPVNHIEAHLYAPHFEHNIPFPNIGVVISGGHTLIFLSHSHKKHILLGSTVDDAIGECFDKVAKHFNLGYPGGPIIDKKAREGNPISYSFPHPKFKIPKIQNTGKETYKLSYSGLKTAVIHRSSSFRHSNKLSPNISPSSSSSSSSLKEEEDFILEDLLASFQKTAFDILFTNIEKALNAFKNIEDIVITGGVACNSYLRKYLLDLVKKEEKTKWTKLSTAKSYFPSPQLSTDNAAMVAGLAYHLYNKDKTTDFGLSPLPKIVKNGNLI